MLETWKIFPCSLPDPSVNLYPLDYCEIVREVTDSACFETSLLEMWAVDGRIGEGTAAVLAKLTQEDIVNAVNNITYR